MRGLFSIVLLVATIALGACSSAPDYHVSVFAEGRAQVDTSPAPKTYILAQGNKVGSLEYNLFSAYMDQVHNMMIDAGYVRATNDQLADLRVFVAYGHGALEDYEVLDQEELRNICGSTASLEVARMSWFAKSQARRNNPDADGTALLLNNASYLGLPTKAETICPQHIGFLAFDPLELAENDDVQPLWSASVSVRSLGCDMAEAAPVMLASATHHLGRSSTNVISFFVHAP